MSHFCVFVLGEDVEKQLAPYHEYECTGLNDEYVVDVDITSDLAEKIESGNWLETTLEEYGLHHSVVEYESHVDRTDAHKYGYAVVRDGKLIKAVDRTNPNAKWDWYQEGGRYFERLLLKDGSKANTALWGEVDIKGMRQAQVEKFREWRSRMRAIIGDAPQPDSWKTVLERNGESVDAARAEYWAQPAMDRLRKSGDSSAVFANDGDIQKLYWSDAKFDDHASRQAMAAFAIVKNGKWHERGQMLMFGVVADEKDEETWYRECDSLLESLDPNTRITVVDCHI